MIRSSAAALLLAAASLGVQAKTITVTGVLDATTITRDFEGGDFYHGDPFTMEKGDVVRLDLSFLPGQALQLQRAAWIGLVVRGDQSSIQPTLGVMGTFTGLTGVAHQPTKSDAYVLASGGNLAGDLNYWMWQTGDDLGWPHGIISFTGVSIEMTVLDDATLAGHRFYGIGFESYAMDWAQAISVVPEPTEALLLSLGLVALTGAVRRRRPG